MLSKQIFVKVIVKKVEFLKMYSVSMAMFFFWTRERPLERVSILAWTCSLILVWGSLQRTWAMRRQACLVTGKGSDLL